MVSGAQAAQARSRKARAWLGRAREAVSGREVCGAAAKRCRSGARAAAEGRRRSGGGGAVYGRGYRGNGFVRRKKHSDTDAWAHRRVK